MIDQSRSSEARTPASRWLWRAVAVCAAVNVAIVIAFLALGNDLQEATRATAYRHSFALLKDSGCDSWDPMVAAWEAHRADPDRDLYRVFFDDHVKFQYPPSSLLLVAALPSSVIENLRWARGCLSPFRVTSFASLLAVLATIACSVLLFARAALDEDTRRAWQRPMLEVAVAGSLLGFTFYPLAKGHVLGQIQVYLGCLVAFGTVAFVTGRRALAGVCFGLCCLAKPQYAIVFVWGLLRGERRFAWGMLSASGLGLALSVLMFGFDSHLRYLDVLRLLSRHGEAFVANQSVNGILHRFLGNGNALEFESSGFPPYHAAVHYLTLISSLLMLGATLWYPQARRRPETRVHDLALVVMASTMASPIAWEHHYGAFLPMFGVLVPVLMERKPAGRATAPLLVAAYALVANAVLRPDVLFTNRVLGLLAANAFWGGLTLFVLGVVARAQPATRGARDAAEAQRAA